MRIASHAWDFQYTDYTDFNEEGLIVWEQFKYWAFFINLPLKWRGINIFPAYKEPWFYWRAKAKYDGVPYYVTRIGIFYFTYGQSGGWGGVDRIRELDEFDRGIK